MSEKIGASAAPGADLCDRGCVGHSRAPDPARYAAAWVVRSAFELDPLATPPQSDIVVAGLVLEQGFGGPQPRFV